MGKYDKIIKDLPSLPAEDLKYQEKIDAIKAEIKSGETHTPESLCNIYQLARRGNGAELDQETQDMFIEILGKDGIEEMLSLCQQRVTALEQLLQESYDHDETGWGMYGAKPNMVRLKDGSSLSVQMEPTGKVEDKEKFRQWCVANGLETSLQLWPSTMNALTKEKLLAGEPAPDGVKAYVKPKVILRKGGSKDDD